jgi:hypothetical protein
VAALPAPGELPMASPTVPEPHAGAAFMAEMPVDTAPADLREDAAAEPSPEPEAPSALPQAETAQPELAASAEAEAPAVAAPEAADGEPTLPVWAEMLAAAGAGLLPAGSTAADVSAAASPAEEPAVPAGPDLAAAGTAAVAGPAWLVGPVTVEPISVEPISVEPISVEPALPAAAAEPVPFEVGSVLDHGVAEAVGRGIDEDEEFEAALFAAGSTESGSFAGRPFGPRPGERTRAEPISVESAWEIPSPSPFDHIVWALPPGAARVEDPFAPDDDPAGAAWPPLFNPASGASVVGLDRRAPGADPTPAGTAVPTPGPVSGGADEAEDLGGVPVLATVPVLDPAPFPESAPGGGVAATGGSAADADGPEGPSAVMPAAPARPDVDISVRYVDGVAEVATTEVPVPLVTVPETAVTEPAAGESTAAEITFAGRGGSLAAVADLDWPAERPETEPETTIAADDPLGVGPVLAARSDGAEAADVPGAELVLAPWPPAPVAPVAGPPGALAVRGDVDGPVEVSRGWVQETASPAPTLPPIRLADLHALWDGEADLDTPADAPAGSAVALSGPTPLPARPAVPVSTELAAYQPWPAPDLSRYLPAPLEITAGATGQSQPAPPPASPATAAASEAAPSPAAATASPVTDATAATAKPASPPTPGGPGPRARARAERRGVRRRRTITIVVAIVVALIAAGVPIALSQSAGTASVAASGPAPSSTPSAHAPSRPPAAPSASATTQTSATPPVGAGQMVPGASEAPGSGGPNRPGTPGVLLQAYAGGVTVTVTAPYLGGPVTSYQITATPGGTQTLTGPGSVQVALDGCAQTVVTVRAVGPDGTSDASAPQQAVACVPPSEPTDVLAVPDGAGHLIIGWNVPQNVGGNQIHLQYVVTVYRTGPTGVTSESFTVVGDSYTRNAPSASDPYIRIEVAARNTAGVGPAVAAWTSH